MKTKYAASAFDGEGARRYGGRWNSPGVAIVYTAGSASLAELELLVHIDQSQLLATSYSIVPVSFDESLLTVVDSSKLVAGWEKYPAPSVLQQLGDDWAHNGASVVLEVPSAVVPQELNYLLNPNHPDFNQLEIGPTTALSFDPRLKD